MFSLFQFFAVSHSRVEPFCIPLSRYDDSLAARAFYYLSFHFSLYLFYAIPQIPSAHAVEREFRVLNALFSAGLPVARPLFLCENTNVIGTPFYVMDYVQGEIGYEKQQRIETEKT